jgi:hypothetical protein
MSDLARVYASGKEPMLVAGTAASIAAGAGMPEVNGSEKASVKNGSLSHDYKDDRAR